jgi:hypothetical protein
VSSSAAITLCVASQRVFNIVSAYFVIDSVWKLLDIPPYDTTETKLLIILSLCFYLTKYHAMKAYWEVEV